MKRTHIIVGLLAISLAMNGFLVSILLAEQRFTPPPSPLKRMETALAVLDANEQAVVRSVLDEHRSRFEAQTDTMHQKISLIQSILTAPKFDKQALARAFDRGADRDAMRQNMKSLLIAIAVSLPDDDRIRFFTAAEKQMPPRKR